MDASHQSVAEIRRQFEEKLVQCDLQRLSQAEIAALEREHPGLPAEYLVWMKEVGWGNFGAAMLYSGPVPPQEIFATTANEDLEGFVLFADDFAGGAWGFDLRGKRAQVVTVTEDDPPEAAGIGFLDTVRAWLLDGAEAE